MDDPPTRDCHARPREEAWLSAAGWAAPLRGPGWVGVVHPPRGGHVYLSWVDTCASRTLCCARGSEINKCRGFFFLKEPLEPHLLLRLGSLLPTWNILRVFLDQLVPDLELLFLAQGSRWLAILWGSFRFLPRPLGFYLLFLEECPGLCSPDPSV